jgi:hypothetical protein
MTDIGLRVVIPASEPESRRIRDVRACRSASSERVVIPGLTRNPLARGTSARVVLRSSERVVIPASDPESRRIRDVRVCCVAEIPWSAGLRVCSLRSLPAMTARSRPAMTSLQCENSPCGHGAAELFVVLPYYTGARKYRTRRMPRAYAGLGIYSMPPPPPQVLGGIWWVTALYTFSSFACLFEKLPIIYYIPVLLEWEWGK